jgi:hypothetical protein
MKAGAAKGAQVGAEAGAMAGVAVCGEEVSGSSTTVKEAAAKGRGNYW